MNGLLETLVGVYFACVDFLIHTANLLGVTYRDTNAALFFLVWPAVTVALMTAALVQARTLRRLRERASPE